jgi:hypothetical protein
MDAFSSSSFPTRRNDREKDENPVKFVSGRRGIYFLRGRLTEPHSQSLSVRRPRVSYDTRLLTLDNPDCLKYNRGLGAN